MKDHDREIVFSSGKSSWETPVELFEKLDDEFDFILDAAADENNTKCADFLSEEDDALACSWACGGNVWVNPPYGRTSTPRWVEKAWEESQKGTTVVMLLPARTDTKWFHQYVYGRAEIRFLKGRLKFLNEDKQEMNAAPFPSMIIVFKPSWSRSL